ncbi:MAG: hypothetical protein AUJ75_02020 [Candidatus Omnitrophica bacterium CG1_02_49_10]|nr:MAG: hypothetical protein AUJ75_02020 [Candidatus Omnitrophica bacterium CG1_02_49_10]
MAPAVLTALTFIGLLTLAAMIGLLIWKLASISSSGEKELESKKKLIDQNLFAISRELKEVQNVMRNIEKDREGKFANIKTHLESTARETAKLQETTSQLKMALADSRVRGQWGERMAEDILRLSGLIEGINYHKQKNLEGSSGRPDFTFLLPQDRILNMDVKFPCDNYMRYLESESEGDKGRYKSQFLKDIRGRIKEVTTREYINPEDKTVDYVIVFIPNEQIYAFIQENDNLILDEAMRNKVILSSPLTLYAILAVIRQAVDNFYMEKATSRILSLLGAFNKQWKVFASSMEKMGRRIDETKKEFDELSLKRKNLLEKPLNAIEDIRKERGIKVDTSHDISCYDDIESEADEIKGLQ